MRLIDAEALLAECKEAQKTDPNADGRGWANHFLNAAGEPSAEWYCVEDMIENAPTIDAVPVVRCRECRYYEIVQLRKDGEDDHRYKPSVCVRGKYAEPRKPEWYCADGKRKEDAK